MKILFASAIALIICIIAVAFTTATVVSNNNNKDGGEKVLMAINKNTLPASFQDPAIANFPEIIGLPFGDFSTQSEAQITTMLFRQFPHLLANTTTEKTALRVEMIRFSIFKNALIARNQPGDEKVVKVMTLHWVCEACEWCVSHMEDFLKDKGCDEAAGYISDLCLKVPFVPKAAHYLCKKVLDWGCEKIADEIEKHITSPNRICDDVFRLHC